jgi:hypothetical protein
VTTRAEGRHSGGLIRLAVGLMGALAVIGLAVVTIFGAPARAASPSAATDCDTYPYCTTSSMGSTTSTTGSITVTLTLTIHYSGGIVNWQECGFPPGATGATVRLYLDGIVQSQPGGSAAVEANGCTNDSSFPLCLAPATYTAVGVVDQYGEASATFTVSSPGCANPVALAASSATAAGGASSGGGGLAFTGADLALVALVAVGLIGVGITVVRLNRRRRHA